MKYPNLTVSELKKKIGNIKMEFSFSTEINEFIATMCAIKPE